MRKIRYIFIFYLLSVLVYARKSYEGYKVFKVQPSIEIDFNSLTSLFGNVDLDFFSTPRHSKKPVDVMVSPTAQEPFVSFLNTNKMNYNVLSNNVEESLKEERRRQKLGSYKQGNKILNKYLTYDEIDSYLSNIANAYSDLVTFDSIGRSFEGRNIPLIKISTNPSANKPVIFIDAGIHAREWIAHSQALYIISQLVTNSTNRYLLDKVDWQIVPVLNPDGYEYTHTADRLWRKTRSTSSTSSCVGVDANRNFGHHWAEEGSTTSECSFMYHGPAEFSEPETRAFRNYFDINKEDIKLYVSLHSCGQYIMYPWGVASEETAANAGELQELAESVRDGIKSISGTYYAVGSIISLVHSAAGSSVDWTKGVAGVELSYAIELPCGWQSDFELSPERISPIVTETWAGFLSFHSHIEKKFGVA